MRITLGLIVYFFAVVAFALTVMIAVACLGQDIITLPIEKHTDNLQDALLYSLVARRENDPVIRVSTNGFEVFSVTILSRMEDRNSLVERAWKDGATYGLEAGFRNRNSKTQWIDAERWVSVEYEKIFGRESSERSSNVIARIVWKGKTNECVLERNP